MKNNYWEQIHGWFDYSDIYDEAIARAKDGDIFVELGTWMGKSTCYLAQGLKEKNVDITFYACDLFEVPDYNNSFLTVFPNLTAESFYSAFLNNLKQQEVLHIVTPIKMNSLDFANLIEDNSVDFIFIDDNHDDVHVFDELVVWYPKMKKTGWMAGHDKVPVAPALERFKKLYPLFEYFLIGNSWVVKCSN